MTIIPQDGNSAVNYTFVKMLYIRPAEAEDIETGHVKNVYAIAAVLVEETTPFILGFYNTKKSAQEVFGKIISAVSSGTTKGYVMPDSDATHYEIRLRKGCT